MMNENLESISQRGGTQGGRRSGGGGDDSFGLSSKTPLNDRYFSQPDLIGADDRDHGDNRNDRSRSSGNLVRGKLSIRICKK